MAIGIVMDFKGATLEQYDQVAERMGVAGSHQAPEGALSHWVCATDDGIRITDVWESREQFEKFAQEQIGPHSEAVGIPGPPQISFHDAHNYMLSTSSVPA